MLNISTNNLHFLPVSRFPRGGNSPRGSNSPRAVRLVVACLRRFGTLRKNTSWIFGACILWILSIFVDLGMPQVVPDRMTTPPPTARSQQPPCSTATGKQTRTGTKYPVRRIPPHSDIGSKIRQNHQPSNLLANRVIMTDLT